MKWLTKWSYSSRLESAGLLLIAAGLKCVSPTLSALIQHQFYQTKQAITANPRLQAKSWLQWPLN